MENLMMIIVAYKITCIVLVVKLLHWTQMADISDG